MERPIRRAYLVASGDLRVTANRDGWPAQEAMERDLTAALRDEGVEVVRAHPFDPEAGHGFIASQRMGMDVFARIPRQEAVVVAEAVWQYSHHVLAGLRSHRGPILTVANWSGQWPGLVGMLNLNGSLTKAGVHYSTLWSERLRRCVLPRRTARLDSRRRHPARPRSRSPARPAAAAGGRSSSARRTAGAGPRARQGHPGRVRRGLHGDVQRHHRRRAAQPAGHLQGAPQPERAGREMRRVSDADALAVRRWLDARA
jgi:hypothetical protein